MLCVISDGYGTGNAVWFANFHDCYTVNFDLDVASFIEQLRHIVGLGERYIQHLFSYGKETTVSLSLCS